MRVGEMKDRNSDLEQSKKDRTKTPAGPITSNANLLDTVPSGALEQCDELLGCSAF